MMPMGISCFCKKNQGGCGHPPLRDMNMFIFIVCLVLCGCYGLPLLLLLR